MNMPEAADNFTAREPEPTGAFEPTEISADVGCAGRALRLRELIVPFAVLAVLYGCTLTRNLSAAHDSIAYINSIDTGVGLYHQHHLLYNPLGSVWVKGLRAVGMTADSALLVAALNGIFGALSMCVFYALLRARLKLGVVQSLIGTALPAFSYGVWFYSVCIEVYIIPLFFLLLTLYVVSGGSATARTFALAGATHGLAVLFHQVHVMFAVVIAAAALLHYRRNIAGAVRACVVYAAVAVPLVVLPYAAVMIFSARIQTPAGALRWLTAYAHEGQFWHSLSLGTLLKALVGTSKTLVGGQFVFALPWAREFLRRMLAGNSLSDEIFLVRNISVILAAGLTVLAVIFGVGFAAGLTAALARIRRLPARARLLLVLIAVWLAPYCVFFFFWEPMNVEMWIPQSVCAWLILMMAFAGRAGASRPATVLLAVLAAAGLATNYLGSIRPMADLRNDWYYARVAGLRGAREGDLAVVPREWVWKKYVERYSAAEPLMLLDLREDAGSDDDFMQAAAERIDAALAAGAGVYVLGEAVDPPADMLGGSRLTPEILSEFWDNYRDRWRPAAPGANAYVLTAQQGTETSGQQ